MTQAEHDQAMTKCKKYVYKNRIRLNEFFRDFDKLRCGYIFPNHFLSGLNMAGLNKYLSVAELDSLSAAYTEHKGLSLDQVDYRRFCHDVDLVFTHPELEKNPLDDVPREPYELLDKERFRRSARLLELENEAKIEAAMMRIQGMCERRGVLVKPFFDDSARSRNSSCLVGHVTIAQFKQTLDVSLSLGLSPEEADLIVAKYVSDDYPEMVNYLAFAATVDPPEGSYNPYTQ